MTTLILAEHDNSRLNEATAKTVAAATKLGGDIHVLVAGKGAANVAADAAKLSGVSKVLLAESDSLEHALAEPLAALIVSLAGPYDALVAPATTSGKNVMPRVAALLDVMQVSDVMEVLGPDTFRRPTYAGNAIQTVRSKDAKKVLTIRIASFTAAEGGSGMPRSRRSPLRPTPAFPPSWRKASPAANGRSSPRRKSSSPAAARSARAKNSWR